MGGSTGANLAVSTWLMDTDPLWSSPSSGSGFSSLDAESNGVGVYIPLAA